MKKLLAATKNSDKLIEFKRILEPLGYDVIPQSDIDAGLDVEETGSTFAENAYLKAEALHKATGFVVIADDSGLEIDALDKAPGIYSARFCGEDTPYSEKNGIILERLKDVPDALRTARFVCAVCFISETGAVTQVQEACEGKIAYEAKGNNGFGYDPIFLYGDKTTAEMNDEEKDRVSHRGKALRALAAELKGIIHE